MRSTISPLDVMSKGLREGQTAGRMSEQPFPLCPANAWHIRVRLWFSHPSHGMRQSALLAC
jgi:hypothetical protein